MFLATSHSQGGSNLILLLLMAGLFGMYFLFLRAQSRRRKQTAAMQESLSAGAHVLTVGGLCGTVVDVGDDTVTLQVAPGVTNVYLRGAIQKVLTAEEAARASLAPAPPSVDDTADDLDDADETGGTAVVGEPTGGDETGRR